MHNITKLELWFCRHKFHLCLTFHPCKIHFNLWRQFYMFKCLKFAKIFYTHSTILRKSTWFGKIKYHSKNRIFASLECNRYQISSHFQEKLKLKWKNQNYLWSMVYRPNKNCRVWCPLPMKTLPLTWSNLKIPNSKILLGVVGFPEATPMPGCQT